jgi:uncharacterized protein
MNDETTRGRHLTTAEQLREHYGEPYALAFTKEVDHLHPQYRPFIEASPFFVLATASTRHVDCSPRGDAAGFVEVLDDKTLLIPDRPGNNRIESLLNIVEDPRVALLFLVPGVGEMLRVRGRASISIEPRWLERFSTPGKSPPKTVLVVTVESVYFQCARALLRGRVWDPTTHVPRDTLPSAGAILTALSRGRVDGKAYDQEDEGEL